MARRQCTRRNPAQRAGVSTPNSSGYVPHCEVSDLREATPRTKAPSHMQCATVPDQRAMHCPDVLAKWRWREIMHPRSDVLREVRVESGSLVRWLLSGSALPAVQKQCCRGQTPQCRRGSRQADPGMFPRVSRTSQQGSWTGHSVEGQVAGPRVCEGVFTCSGASAGVHKHFRPGPRSDRADGAVQAGQAT